MALHSRDAATVSAAVATRSCADCSSREIHRRKSLINVTGMADLSDSSRCQVSPQNLSFLFLKRCDFFCKMSIIMYVIKKLSNYQILQVT